jgi:putrescine aminotransferase
MNDPGERDKLLGYDDALKLDIGAVTDLYRRYVNPGQVDILSRFSFAKDRITRAEGCYLETSAGRRILDMTGGHGLLAHGHNHPRILAVRQRFQNEKRMEVHKSYLSPWMAALCHNIAALCGGDLCRPYCVNSGAEAIDGALKLAFRYHAGKRQTILHSDISYHGKLIGAGSVSGQLGNRHPIPRLPGCVSYRYGDLASVAAAVAAARARDGRTDVCAILVEPLSASTLRECTPEFMQGLRRLCDEHDIVLVCDEVFTGWAKCGPMFYFSRSGITPDVLTTSKAFGGGKSSISAYVTTPRVFERAYGTTASALLHTTTYNGFGEETVTAIEALRIAVDEDFPARAALLHGWLREELRETQRAHADLVAEVRGAGTLQGFVCKPQLGLVQPLLKLIPNETLRDPLFLPRLVAAAITNEMYSAHGILTYFAEGVDVPICVAPPMQTTREQVAEFGAALRRTLGRGVLPLCLSFATEKLRR